MIREAGKYRQNYIYGALIGAVVAIFLAHTIWFYLDRASDEVNQKMAGYFLWFLVSAICFAVGLTVSGIFRSFPMELRKLWLLDPTSLVGLGGLLTCLTLRRDLILPRLGLGRLSSWTSILIYLVIGSIICAATGGYILQAKEGIPFTQGCILAFIAALMIVGSFLHCIRSYLAANGPAYDSYYWNLLYRLTATGAVVGICFGFYTHWAIEHFVVANPPLDKVILIHATGGIALGAAFVLSLWVSDTILLANKRHSEGQI